MKRVGIEAINVYGTSLFLDQKDLATARGKDPQTVLDDYLINTRSLNPVWEDTVTMGANAALPLFKQIKAEEIGLLIVGTEGSVDFGKPISTNIHRALGLSANVRNYETKFACYSAAAAMDAAVNWVASGLNHGKKALVIATDFSRRHFGKPEEFVLGGLAAAMVISDTPKILEYDLGWKGTWTVDAYDTFRPTAKAEMGNNEVSLYTYMDAVQGAYADYLSKVGDALGRPVNFDQDFVNMVYHTPFPGMAFQAHRTICRDHAPKKKAELQEDFQKRVFPALRFARRLGSSYGGSNFAGLASAIMSNESLKGGERIGFFAYGSGAIGEFYSGRVVSGARELVAAMDIDGQLDARRRVSVAEYEAIENLRESYVEARDFVPDFASLGDWYQKHYEGSGKLVLKEVKNFYRTYERV